MKDTLNGILPMVSLIVSLQLYLLHFNPLMKPCGLSVFIGRRVILNMLINPALIAVKVSILIGMTWSGKVTGYLCTALMSPCQRHGESYSAAGDLCST